MFNSSYLRKATVDTAGASLIASLVVLVV